MSHNTAGVQPPDIDAARHALKMALKDSPTGAGTGMILSSTSILVVEWSFLLDAWCSHVISAESIFYHLLVLSSLDYHVQVRFSTVISMIELKSNLHFVQPLFLLGLECFFL